MKWEMGETAPNRAGMSLSGSANLGVQAQAGSTVKIIQSPPPVPAKRVWTLPARVKDFTGRETERLRLSAILTASGRAAVSAVGGMGGVGKTSLALEVAHAVAEHFPSGALFLNLRGQSDRPMTPVEAMSAILRQLGHIAEQLHDSAEALQPYYLGALAGERLLLVLDDARDTSQVELLLPPEPVALLVTSRDRLALHDVDQLDLEVLPEGEAVTFLCGILGPNRASDSEFRLLTERCGRLPIALRTAGVLLRDDPTLPLAECLADLASERTRLAALQVPGNTSLDVRLVLAHSVTTLERQDATLVSRWQQLAVFPASFDSAAAAAVWDAGTTAPSILGQVWSWARRLVGSGETRSTFRHRDPRRDLTSLVRRSLLLHDPTTNRYRLHDLYRDLAAAGLGDAAKETAEERHSWYFAAALGKADDLYLEGGDKVLEGLAVFERERANIEAGQAWAVKMVDRNDEAALLAAAYPRAGVHVLSLRLPTRTRIAWLEAQAAACRKLGDRRGESEAMGNVGIAWADLGEARKAIEFYKQVLVIAREIGDREAESAALGNLGNASFSLGDNRKAIGFYEQQLAIAREIGDRRSEGIALGNLGNAWTDLREARKAIGFYEQMLVIARESGDRRGEGNTLGNLGIALDELGEARKAIGYYEQQLAVAREIGDRGSEGNALGNLGNAWAALGEARKAIGFHEHHLVIAREIGDRRGEGAALWNSALGYDTEDERDRAIELARASLLIRRQIEDPERLNTEAGLREWGVDPDAV